MKRHFLKSFLTLVLAMLALGSYAQESNELTISPGDNLEEVKANLGDAASDITELYITGNYTTTASINVLKSDYFPNLAKVHLTLQTSATSIAASAYSGCTLLTEIVVPNTITSIGSSAFSGCSSLESMTLPFVGGSATAKSASSSTLFGYIFGSSSYTGGVSTKQYYNSSSSSTYYIPSSLKSVTITGGNLLYGAFYGCSGFTSITIPNGVTSIGDRAFYNCSGLTSITIPNGVTSIGSYTFYACIGLKSITIPESVTSIGSYAFRGCSGFTSITIPENVTSIGSSAFAGCSSLESMTLPFVGSSATATSAGYSALFGYIFGGSSYTGGVKIIQSFESGYINTYYIPSSLKSVTITGGNLLYGAFYGCSGLTSITISDGVTSIGDRAFYNCSGLTSITIPENVTSIGSSAFAGCSSLKSMTLPFVGGSATATSASSSTLFGYIFGESSYTGGVSTKQYYNSSSSSTYYIPSSLKSVTITGRNLLSGAFSDCSGLTSITIPDGVTSIVERAFSGCTGLTSITIPNSVTSIGDRAFSGCTGLTSITIPENVTSIGSYAFEGCSGLGSLTLSFSKMVTIASASAIPNDFIIYVPSSLLASYREADYWSQHSSQFVAIGAQTEYNVEVSAKTTMSALHEEVGEDNLNNVISLKVSGTINSYDLMIMRNKMTNLKHLDLSDAKILGCSYEYYQGYHSVEDTWTRYAFNPGLETLILPVNLVKCEDYAMADLTHISELKVPSTVTSIGAYFANYNGALQKVYFDEDTQLASIGQDAFKGCTSLQLFELEKVTKMTSLGSVFGENHSSLVMTVPNCVTSLSNSGQFGTGKLIIADGEKTLNIDLTRDAFSSKNQEVYLGRNFVITRSSGTTSNTLFSSLSKLTIGDIVTSIPAYSFSIRMGVGSVLNTISGMKNVSSIAQHAFGVSRIHQIDYTGSLDTWVNIKGIENLIRDEYGTEIAKKLTINGSEEFDFEGENVTNISAYSFYHIINVRSLHIPATVTTIGEYAFAKCSNMTSCVLPTNSQLTEIPAYAFDGCSKLQKMDLPVSVQKIGDYAFRGCTSMEETRIPSSIRSIGGYAFNGSNKLNDVYTYTVIPQEIDQNTFSTYQTATLHVPAISYYNYYYDTQWSQFLNLVNFNEPYTYVFIDKDFEINTDKKIIEGCPLFEILNTAGLKLKGAASQTFSEIRLKADRLKAASLIARAELTANMVYIDIDVQKNMWEFFTFPFDVDLTQVQKEGNYVFRRYDGNLRAQNGSGGWQDITDNKLKAGVGYIFRTDTDGTLSIPFTDPNLQAVNVKQALEGYTKSEGDTPAKDKNWNFVGNPYTSYYNINDLDYSAPIVCWDVQQQKYVAYRPGDDDFVLRPFQPFFLQKGEDVDYVGYAEEARVTGTEAEEELTNGAKRRARARRMNQNRQLINLTLSDGKTEDKTRVVFNNEQLMTYEIGCDVVKMASLENTFQLYTVGNDGTKYAINERPQGDGFVQLGYVAPEAGTFTLSATRMDVPVIVHDNLEGITFNLAEGNYSFQTEAGSFADRFAISMAQATAIDSVTADENAAAGNGENTATYDISGRAVSKDAKGIVIKGGKKVLVK